MHERDARREVILEGIKRRPPGLIQGDYLAVDHGLVRHRPQRLGECRVPGAEILVVARAKVHPAAGLKSHPAKALELICLQVLSLQRRTLGLRRTTITLDRSTRGRAHMACVNVGLRFSERRFMGVNL